MSDTGNNPTNSSESEQELDTGVHSGDSTGDDGSQTSEQQQLLGDAPTPDGNDADGDEILIVQENGEPDQDTGEPEDSTTEQSVNNNDESVITCGGAFI